MDRVDRLLSIKITSYLPCFSGTPRRTRLLIKNLIHGFRIDSPKFEAPTAENALTIEQTLSNCSRFSGLADSAICAECAALDYCLASCPKRLICKIFPWMDRTLGRMPVPPVRKKVQPRRKLLVDQKADSALKYTPSVRAWGFPSNLS